MRRQVAGPTVDRMAPPRDIHPRALVHTMSRGNFRQETFLDGAHYRRYLDLLERVAARRLWSVLDWCLIPNHFHLLIQLNCGGLSAGMRDLNGGFSRWSNAQTGRTGTGHLWKNRFTAVEVEEQEHFLETARYIPNNPVEAGLVDRPEDWPWSGYRATVGLERPRRFHDLRQLLAYFGTRPQTAKVRYIQFVRDGLVRSGHASWSDQGYGSPQGPGSIAT
jgi:putative transposase